MLTCPKLGYLRILIIQIAISCYLQALQAQPLREPNLYTAEVGTYLSSSVETPFWLRANQYGIVPNRSPVVTFRAGLHSDYDTSRYRNGRWRDSKFDLAYGVNVVVNGTQNGLSYERNVLLPEAYIKARRGIWEMYVGRRREKFSLADSTLSSGSYAWSGNAMPIPKIQIAIPNFAPIGFTKGWVSIQGTFAHGYLDANGYILNPMLHQKSLYLRFGRQRDFMRVYAGINHQAVWGGRVADPSNVPSTVQGNGELPTGLRNYFYVVTTMYPKSDDPSEYNYFDLTNRIGNHLGSVDIATEIDLTKYTLYIYRQNLFEDGSLYYLINIADGLNGIRIRKNDDNAVVKDILFEFLNTTSQGGPEFIIDDPLRRGKDDYFNHQQFRDGWAYRQHTIGTPFIPPALGPRDQYPYGIFTVNNRVYVFHTGLSGNLPLRGRALTNPVTYQLKLSYSHNLGTYNFPYSPVRTQFSGYASVMTPIAILGGLHFTGSIAFDSGTLYQNSIGTFLSLKKYLIHTNLRRNKAIE